MENEGEHAHDDLTILKRIMRRDGMGWTWSWHNRVETWGWDGNKNETHGATK